MIRVTCGIIINGNKMLAVQRGPNSGHPMKWEFPGGKINQDESAEQCIVRELKEELNVGVRILKRLEGVDYKYPTTHIELIPFVCAIISGELVLIEHIEKYWFNPADWKTIDWLDADYELILKNEGLFEQIVG